MVIPGDNGDVYADAVYNETTPESGILLIKPVLMAATRNLTPDEVDNTVYNIVMNAFNSLGEEAFESQLSDMAR